MVILDFVDLPEDDPERERMYSEHLYCPYDDLSFEELEPRSFSFNSPFGACPECTGIGTRMEVDPELIVPDEDKSLDEGAIPPWSHGHTKDYFGRLIGALADALGFRTDIPFAGLPQRAKKALLYGHKTQIEVRYRNRYGRERVYTTPSKAPSRSSSGGTASPRATPAASASRATCARCPAPPVRARA